jgi:hypothetical protein
MSSETRGVDRRGFLALAGAGGLALVAGSAGSARAASAGPTITVWQLDPDWGYPRGPHAKTRLISRASRRAAANRYALSEQDALDMNLHLCSFAPAVERTVSAATFGGLWDLVSYEWTNPSSGTVVRVLDRRHLSAAEAASLDRAAAPAAGGGTGLPATAAAARDADDPVGVLPFTGGIQGELVAVGVAALIGGAVAIRQGGGRAGDARPDREPAGADDR